jgi:hypothetical protein
LVPSPIRVVSNVARSMVQFEPISTSSPISTRPVCAVAYYCGSLESVLGRYDEAETHFAKAAQLNARGQMEFAAAATHLGWGRMLSARGGPGDLERARDLLAQANDAAVSRGYASVAWRAAAALSDLD